MRDFYLRKEFYIRLYETFIKIYKTISRIVRLMCCRQNSLLLAISVYRAFPFHSKNVLWFTPAITT